MRLSELLEGIDHEVLKGDAYVGIQGISMDSREVKEGFAFVCIRGAVRDGHEFIDEALRAGAIALVIDRREDTVLEKANLRAVTVVYTKDSRAALAHMAAAWHGYPAQKLITIGITGTKGKTTTSYMIKSILENAGRKVGLIGTNEVIIGRKHLPARNTTPDALTLHGLMDEMVRAGLDTLVMEVSSQAIKLRRTEGILFDYGIFTNLSPDHIGAAEHRDFREYLECKQALFRQCKVGLVNGDDPYHEEITDHCICSVETYGFGEECSLRAGDLRYERQDGKLGISFRITGLMDFDVYLPLPGRFSAYNALAAVGICRHFRVRESDILRSLRSIKIKGRIEAVDGPMGYTVLIDYAHNPMALASLLETLRQYHPGRLICLFGCGGDRPIMRRRLMGQISGRLADLTVVTDDNPRSEDPAVIRGQIWEGVRETGGEGVIIPDRRDAIRYCLNLAKEGDIIVLAGKGHETDQEIRGVSVDMDERKIVQEIMDT